MKKTMIRRSRNFGMTYLILSVCILGLFIYLFINDKEIYPKGKSFYWIGIALGALLTLRFIYNLIDKRPLYVFDEKGIYTRGSQEIILWKDPYYFESEISRWKFVTNRYIILSDQNGKEIITIDLTQSDITTERMERILKKKLKRKSK